MKNNNFRLFLLKLEEMKKLKGYIINKESEKLEVSFKILVMNFGELRKFISKVPVFSVAQKKESENFQIEALRLFVNFLNSAYSHICHMRNYIRFIYKDENLAFSGAYKKEIEKRFESNQLAKFLIELRNYFDHVEILPIGISTTFNETGAEARIFLNKETIISSEKFKKETKIFLSSLDKTIDVLDICKEYIELNLFPWIMKQQTVEHKKEFDEYKRMQSELKKLYNNGA